jgi:nucleoside-diphosphate-sugar epimerase
MDLLGKRIAILGCGYLGERVAQQALAWGAEVVALTRNQHQAERLSAFGLNQIVVAELDSDGWHPLIDRRQDLVLNCVASAGGGVEGYRKSYLQGMRSLVRWVEQRSSQVDSLIFTSSTSVYAQNKGEWVSEEDPAEGATEGAGILREAEALLEEPPPGVERSFILRLGGIYGPGRHHLLDRAFQPQLQQEEGDDIHLNSIHTADICAAIWAAYSAPPEVRGGVFNIVDDAPAPKGEILQWLHAEGKERGLLRAAGGASTSPLRRRARRTDRKISNRKARETLLWNPRFPDYRAGYLPLLEALADKANR